MQALENCNLDDVIYSISRRRAVRFDLSKTIKKDGKIERILANFESRKVEKAEIRFDGRLMGAGMTMTMWSWWFCLLILSVRREPAGNWAEATS